MAWLCIETPNNEQTSDILVVVPTGALIQIKPAGSRMAPAAGRVPRHRPTAARPLLTWISSNLRRIE
jgi:hypothetical protein